MKKNLFYSAALIAGLSMLTSCANDDLVRPDRPGQEVEVVFTASLPDNAMSTRMFSDGNTAKNLTYVVYESGSQDPLIDGTAIFTDRQTTVKLNLITGKEYDIVFWAQAGGKDGAKCYSFSAKDQTVTVDYSKVKTSRDLEDAFFTCKTIEVTGSTSLEAELKRPFAQINVGTDDLTYALAQYTGKNDVYTAMKVTSVYNTLNLKDGTVSTTEAPEFGATTVNRTQETFPVQKPTPLATGENQYEYLNMGYVLVGGEDKITADVDLDFYFDTDIDANGDLEAGATPFRTLPVTGVPLQRNYRTNIYGSLLTSTVDIKVIIVPDFGGEDYDMPIQEFHASSVADINAAIEAVPAGVAAYVIADKALTVNDVMAVSGKNLIVDMGGKDLALNNYANVKDGGAFTVIGANINANSNNVLVANKDGQVILEDCILTGGSSNKLIQSQYNGKVSVNNSIINMTGNDQYALYEYDPSGEITVTNSTINCTSTNADARVISTSPSCTGNITLKNTNINVSGAAQYTIQNGSGANISVEKCNITSNSAIFNVCNNGSGTISLKETNIETSDAAAYSVYSGGSGVVTIDNCTVNNKSNKSYASTVINKESAKTIITNSTISSEKIYPIYNESGTVEIKDSKVVSTGWQCIRGLNSSVTTLENAEVIQNASNGAAISAMTNAKVNVNGGSVVSNAIGTAAKVKSVINMTDDSQLTVTGATIKATKDFTACVAVAKNASATLTNCKVDSKYLGVSTNADTATPQNVTINNCEITGSTAVLVNTPGTTTITDSKLTGWHHTVMARGGNVIINNTDMHLTPELAFTDATVQQYYNNEWGTGTAAPVAVITVGNRHSTSYKYPTAVTLNKCTLKVEGANAAGYPKVYAWANEGTDLGVTFNYDAATNLADSDLVLNIDAAGNGEIVVNGVKKTKK